MKIGIKAFILVLILINLCSCKPSIKSEQEQFQEYIGTKDYEKLMQFMNYVEDRGDQINGFALQILPSNIRRKYQTIKFNV